MLTGLGIEHGVDLDALVATSAWMAGQLGRPSPSAVVRALGGAPQSDGMSSGRLPARRCAEDRHDVPPGPARAQRPRAGRARRALPDPLAAGHARSCSSSAPRSTCSTRTGAGMPAHADGEWDALVRRVRRARAAPSSSATRSSRRRQPDAGRPGDARPRRARGARRLLRPRPRPGSSRPSGRRASSRGASGPTAASSTGSSSGKPPWFCRAFDLPDVLGSWSAGCRPSGCTWSPCRSRGAAPRASCGSGSARRSASTRPGRRSTATARNPSLGVAETQAAPPAQPRGMEPGCPSRAEYRRADPRAARPRDLARAPRIAAGDAAAGRFDWAEEVPSAGSSGSRAAGVDVVGDLDDLRPVRARRAARRGATPTGPRRARSARRRARRAGRADPRGGRAGPTRDEHAAPARPRLAAAAARPMTRSVTSVAAGERAPGPGSRTCARGGTTPWRGLADGAGAPTRGRLPARAPSSSSCCAGSTLAGAARAPRWSTRVLGRLARPAAAGPTSSSSAPSPSRRFGPPAGRPGRRCPTTSCSGWPPACWPTQRAPTRASRSRQRTAPRPRWWRRGYRLVGDPCSPTRVRRPAGRRGPPARRPRPRGPRARQPTWPRCSRTPGRARASARGRRAGASLLRPARARRDGCRARVDLPARRPGVGATRSARPGRTSSLDLGAVPRLVGVRRARAGAGRRSRPTPASCARRVGVGRWACSSLPDARRPLLTTRLLPAPRLAAVARRRRAVVPPERPRLGRGRRGAACARAARALVTLSTATWTRCVPRSVRDPPRPGSRPAPQASLDLRDPGCCSTNATRREDA